MLLVRKLMMLTLAACTEPLAPDLYEAPPVYYVWYDQVWWDCGSTVRAQPANKFSQLRFHTAKFPDYVLGKWNGRDIWIANDLIMWAPVVKHEMLHAQLGTPGHPPVFNECDTLQSSAGLTTLIHGKHSLHAQNDALSRNPNHAPLPVREAHAIVSWR